MPTLTACPHCGRQAIISRWVIVNLQEIQLSTPEELCEICAQDILSTLLAGQFLKKLD